MTKKIALEKEIEALQRKKDTLEKEEAAYQKKLGKLRGTYCVELVDKKEADKKRPGRKPKIKKPPPRVGGRSRQSFVKGPPVSSLPPTKFTEERRMMCINQYIHGGGIVAAAKAAGVSSKAVYDLMKRDPAFNAIMRDIKDGQMETLEDTWYKRSLNGVDEPIVVDGKVVANKKKYFDSMARFLLGGHYHSKYRLNSSKVEISGDKDNPLEFHAVSDVELRSRLREQLEADDVIEGASNDV